jgi:glycosyltransferase involved in cell wall biosynthesis
MIRVVFLVWRLGYGGAERQLLALMQGIDKTRFSVTVVSIVEGGGFYEPMRQTTGITLISLHCHSRRDLLLMLWRFWRLLKHMRPDVLHGYLPIPNLLCLVIGKILGIPVIWGIRSSNKDLSQYPITTRWSYDLSRALANYPDHIIINSHFGYTYYVAQGYPPQRMQVISNGIDTTRFHPDAQARQRGRARWSIAEHQLLIGLVGRLDPMKGIPIFLEAAALFARQCPDARFLCIGRADAGYMQELRHLAIHLGIDERIIWLEQWQDMPEAYNSLDIATSASYTEGFPNVVGEAMACGIPCVVTDVGDSAWIVSDTGVVVPAGNARALAAGWLLSRALETPDKPRQRQERVSNYFSTAHMVLQTERALQQNVHTHRKH